SEERSAARPQKLKHLTRDGTEALDFVLRLMLRGAHAGQRHPFGFIADEKCDGRHAGRDYAARGAGRVLEHRGMRRKTSPSDRSGEAELVKDLRIVVADPAGQNLPFPGTGGDFESLQLAEDFERATLVAKLRSGGHVLPAQKPSHESGCGH